jgi:hypothetical protein
MFANAGGGILLIGIDERRDANGQATGTPDPNAELGVDVPNLSSCFCLMTLG